MFNQSLMRRLAPAAILAISTLGPVAAQAADLELKLALADSGVNPTTDSILRLADTLGIYEKHGLKVTIIALDGTPQAVAALNSGAVDIADISIDAALRLKADNGVAIRGIIAATMGAPYLIAAKADIATVADLKGKSYAIADNGSLDHTLTQVVLNTLGVGGDAPSYVAIGAPPARVQALAAGKVDATTVSYGTFLPIANTPGIHVIVSPEDFAKMAPEQTKFIAALEPTIAAKHDALQAFADAIIDASRQFDTNPAPWIEAMGKARDDLTADNLTATAKFLTGRWCVNGCMSTEKVGRTVDFLYSTKDFAEVKKLAVADIIDQSFATKSIATSGAYAGASIDTP